MRIFIYIILLVITMIASTIYLSIERNAKIEELSNKIKNNHKHQIDSVIIQYENSTDLIFQSMINDESVLILQKKALDAKSDEQRDKYRKELYVRLSPLYSHLKEFGIKQLHFHLPDTSSFIRFHKPSKYGDKLESIRHSLVLANRQMRKISGFEEGRIFNGYRFVYPLMYKSEHIGTVETSIGFNAIKKISKDIYGTYEYMVLDKDVIKNKVFSGEKKNYSKSDINENLYHEINSFVNYKKGLVTENEVISLSLFNKINNKLKVQIDKNDLKAHLPLLKYVKIDEGYYSVSFLPIENIKKYNIGYIISYAPSETYGYYIEEFYKKLILALLIWIVLFFFLYKADISRQKLSDLSKKERDSALLASKSKSEFLANMSHEIRTPLNAILGFVNILKDESRGRKSFKYVEIIDSSSQSLLGIIEDILDFSKIESGKLQIEKIDFNSKRTFEEIIDLYSGICSSKGITLSLKIDDKIPNSINTDPLRIKQVISNLLSNAVKFTNYNKNIKVYISYENKLLGVCVKDEGKGIAEDKLEQIFESFSQEDNSTTREYGGTGLGLSISSSLVKLLDGELKVKSKVGVGSEFYFFIPVTVGNEIKEKKNILQNITFDGIKVLLVEDNKANQMFMSLMLETLNMEFDVANDGLEAVEAFKTNKYDLILMDENMPNLNGIEATKKILKIELQMSLKHTPIIALTANALNGDREKFLSAGMDEYITKPVDKMKIIEVIQEVLAIS